MPFFRKGKKKKDKINESDSEANETSVKDFEKTGEKKTSVRHEQTSKVRKTFSVSMFKRFDMLSLKICKNANYHKTNNSRKLSQDTPVQLLVVERG